MEEDKSPAPITQMEPGKRPQQPPPGPSHLVKDAADTAAARVADAETKSHLAMEAENEVKEIEKVAEEAEVMLQLAKEIHEKCKCR